MINLQRSVDPGDTVIYEATENGILSMLSIVNTQATDATINLLRSGINPDIMLIAKDTVIKPGEAAYVDARVIKVGQKITISTDQKLDIDINII